MTPNEETVECPKCGARIRLTPEQADYDELIVNCPRCGEPNSSGSDRCSNAPLLWQVLAQRSGVLFPDPYLAVPHLPGERSNSSGVDDLKLTEMIRLQRRTFDVGRRRDIIWDIQRNLAE